MGGRSGDVCSTAGLGNLRKLAFEGDFCSAVPWRLKPDSFETRLSYGLKGVPFSRSLPPSFPQTVETGFSPWFRRCIETGQNAGLQLDTFWRETGQRMQQIGTAVS
jgi:hypothetical protein